MDNTKVDISKPACEVEKYIKQYYGLSDAINERYKIVTDFGILVDLLYGFRDEINKKPKEETAKDLPMCSKCGLLLQRSLDGDLVCSLCG